MRINLAMLLIYFFLFTSCNHKDKTVLLSKNGKEYIEYQSSKLYGNYINVVKQINNVDFHYNIKFTDNGVVLHVNKYDNYYYGRENNLESFRHLQLLVTDTSKKNNPNFFGNDVNGYYTDTFIINNVILKQGAKTVLHPISSEEKNMFNLIDSLTKSKKLPYSGFEATKTLGWFSYIF